MLTLGALFIFGSCGGSRPQAQTVVQQQSQQTQAQAAQQTATQPKFERPAGVLRVCADPNNLPFSNERGEGFENKIAELLAADLHERLEYTWWAQRRGFFRNTLKAGVCDVVVGVPSSFELAATTAPYYRSTYVFVYPKGKGISVASFDDPALHNLKVGVQLVGDDGADTPPVHALSARGVVQNVRGYTLYGDYKQPNPPARIVDAVAKGDVDVAVVWGPLAGYFAPRERVPLAVVPVSPQFDLPFLPFVYDISMGVRRGDDDLRQQLDDFLQRRHPDIERILEEYGVPRAGAAGQLANASSAGR
ncbi:MAG TPA: substrate-binding domain-containing protein [Pyrinomonadaceae bacterium]|nr:substrate-binding domain-containing protein [Pyrinomonadaceae bacterium]